MRHARRLTLALIVVCGCSEPKDPAGWAEKAASRNRLDEKLAALQQARSAPGDKKAAVKPLLEVLKQAPKARAAAAVILGEAGDPAAVQPLVDAIDQSSQPERDARDANVAIAGALGALRAREAVPPLAKLVARSDGFTQVAAIDALGAIGDPAAVDALLAVVGNEQAEPFAVKKALMALGRIGDPRAVPAVVRMLYADRPGGTFYPDAAFAASQIGAPMAGPLTAVVQGRDPELEKWAGAHGVHPAALRAKAAQLLGDVGGAEAVPALIGALGYVDADPQAQLFVRVFAAESLGRLRAREAVAPIAALIAKEQAVEARERYADALARIGDPAALPALRAAAKAVSDPDEQVAMFNALSRLGGEAERPALTAARAACGEGCPAAARSGLEGMVARLDAAQACASGGAACWAQKLGDARAEVRDRAALELGRSGDAGNAAALGQAVTRRVETDADLAARFHAVLALDAIARRQPLGAKGVELASAMEAMLASDKGRTLTAGVNEDALRLAGRLRKAAR